MDFDCFKTRIGDNSFTFDSLVEPNGFQNLPYQEYDFNDHILANGPSYGPPIFDGAYYQPHSNNAILLSSGDVNMRNSVELAIRSTGSFDQNVDRSIYNNNQQKVVEDNSLCMLEHVHNNTSSPQLPAPVIHGIEPQKSFPLNSHSSSPHLPASVIHRIETHKSFPLNNLSSLAAERSKLLYDQGANMNSNGAQVKTNGGSTDMKTNLVKGQWSHEEDR